MSDALPERVQRFIGEHIRSIAQLELLLLLSGDPSKAWSVDEVAKALYTAASMTQPLLESLRSSGLAALRDQKYIYSPANPEVAAVVTELAALYQERRVTIVNLIYSAPVDKLQSFADAFRIRPRPPEN